MPSSSDSDAVTPPASSAPPPLLRVPVPLTDRAEWSAAAAKRGLRLEDWAREHLNRASAAEAALGTTTPQKKPEERK